MSFSPQKETLARAIEQPVPHRLSYNMYECLIELRMTVVLQQYINIQ